MKINRKQVKAFKEVMVSGILSQINSEEGYNFFEYDEHGAAIHQHICADDVQFDGTICTCNTMYSSRVEFASEMALRTLRNGNESQARFITWAWYN